jgi:D-3-phosphoglycerate dehydrogenase
VPHRLLVTDEIDPDGLALLRAVPSFTVDEVPTLPADDLLRRIGAYDAIIGRSATRISEPLLRAATRLRVVGRAGVGVDNIALETATELGIAVINAPAGNTVAVAELFFGVIIGLLRHLPRADHSMHEGHWERSALMGSELRGKVLGIVGLGRIGSAVAARARAFGMDVIAYDPYIPDDRFVAMQVRRIATLDGLLAESQICSVHVPLTDETRGMIGAAELARLRPGAVVANLARGGIIQERALADALRSGHLGGAAVDAFDKEPLTGEHALREFPNLLLTPHLGASTVEAQRNVAVDVCEAVRDALLDGELSRSINVTGGPDDWRALQPALLVARRIASVARARLADGGARAVTGINIKAGPELASARRLLLSAAAAGALEGAVEHDRLNLINARAIAAARGIELSVSEGGDAPHPRAIEVRVCAGHDELRVGGVGAGDGPARLTRIGPYHVDVAMRGQLIVLTNHDVPGVIGRVGTALGNARVNIAEYHQARLAQGGEALAVIAVDGSVGQDVRDILLSLPDVLTATIVRFRDA